MMRGLVFRTVLKGRNHKQTASLGGDAVASTSHRVTKRAPLFVGRVKPVSTRLPRLVARGCPAAVPGHFVRDFFLRRIAALGNPLGKTFTEDHDAPRKSFPIVRNGSRRFAAAPGPDRRALIDSNGHTL